MSRDKQKGTSLSLRWLLIIPVIMGLVITSCGDTPVDSETDFVDSSQVNNDINMVPDQFDAVGTIQGTVIDKATGEALSDVAVSLNFMPEDAEEPSILTDTTGSEGTYSFTGVPVNSEYNNSNAINRDNSPYTLKISAENLDNYRDLYRINTALTFDGTGGDGAATNLVSDVTVPLSEQAVTLKGKAHTSADAVLSDAKVELYQEFNPIINGDSDTETDMLVDSATTDSDGNFSFEGVEEKADVWLRFKDDSDPSEVVNMDHPINDETPAADGTEAEMDLGVIDVSSSDQSGAFYITDISPEPGSDVGTDASFTFTFNRPVAENAWTDASQGFGDGTFKDAIFFNDGGPKKSPGDIEFDVSWNDDRTELTIAPDNLVDANEYMLFVEAALDNNTSGSDINNSPIENGPVANEEGNFVDEYGNDLSYGASDYDWYEAEQLEFSTGDNQDAPHTPEVAVDSTSLNTDWDGGSHNLAWNVDNDPAEVKEYEIFISEDDGAYEHLATVPADDAEFGELDYHLNGTSDPNFEYANAGNSQRLIVDDTYPRDEAHSYDVKIRAISANLQQGDFSDPIAFEDVVKPDVYGVDRGAAGNNNDDKLYVKFTEPLKKGLAEDASNYTINDGNGDAVDATINSIEYAYEDIDGPDGTGQYELVITVDDTQDLDDGVELEVSTDVTDLTGNEMRTENDDNIENY